VINGQGGDDRLSGLSGDDILRGNQGNDSLWGGLGNDRLVGGAGNDILAGGAGDNILTGGTGSDRFSVVAGGTARITDFTDGVDFLTLNGLTFAQLNIQQGTGDQASDTLIRQRGTNSVLAILEGVNQSLITAADFV